MYGQLYNDSMGHDTCACNGCGATYTGKEGHGGWMNAHLRQYHPY
eukprot:gene9320-16420_t